MLSHIPSMRRLGSARGKLTMNALALAVFCFSENVLRFNFELPRNDSERKIVLRSGVDYLVFQNQTYFGGK